MWKRTDTVLETTQSPLTVFFMLQVLMHMINTRWKAIPSEEREGIRNYIVGKIIALSSSDEVMHKNSQMLNRLNLVLVSILKQDWPHNWPSFISDIVGSSKTNESLCENNMRILKLLSEEVFDFSKETMTAAKVKTMKDSLTGEFEQVFHLCKMVLGMSEKQPLLISTLQTLQRFLTWIPLGYIFETDLLDNLLGKFFPTVEFRTATLECLTEIASLPPSEVPEAYRPVIQQTLRNFLIQLKSIIPLDADLCAAYATGSEEEKLFVRNLALFLATFLKSYLVFFETPEGRISDEGVVIEAVQWMLRLTRVDEEEIFKSSLDFWHYFARDVYTSAANQSSAAAAAAAAAGNGFGDMMLGPQGSEYNEHLCYSKYNLYAIMVHHLLVAMIDNMAKPEEVIIVENDGEIVRETTKDTDVVAQYKLMREMIVYLAHLNYDDIETIMLEKLDYQLSNFSWGGLNTLCWAIGSISGAMNEVDERRFLVQVIKDLLKLCEEQKGKDNKAVVASNIMYIVGQYPRFLRAHWKFLKTVVKKLFEFMHETHPGVQDMACDTFLKIAQKCKRKFMMPQVEDQVQQEPYILTLIEEIRTHTRDLQPHQVAAFYEAAGTMLSDQSPAIQLHREEALMRLLAPPNEVWSEILRTAGMNVAVFSEPETLKELSKLLRINSRVCLSAGNIYAHQCTAIFNDLMSLYQYFSTQVNAAVAQGGQVAAKHTLIKLMSKVKSDVLELLSCLFEISKDNDGMKEGMRSLLPAVMEMVLGDYKIAPSVVRDVKVLTLFSTVISVMRDQMTPEMPRIMDAIFEPTLEMITTNMVDMPEHRLGFFKFLRQANEHCFLGLFSIPPPQQKLVVDSIVWAFKHTERNISEAGLEILIEMLQNVARVPQISQHFYQSFLLPLVQDVLGIMTDRLHKSGFKLQATVLMHLFHLICSGQVQVPLFDPASNPGIPDNVEFVKAHVAGLLVEAFPNLTKQQVSTFVLGLFDIALDLDAFKQLLRDFLIQVKEFASEDNTGLFEEERSERQRMQQEELQRYQASIPGLIKPDERTFDGDDDDL